MKVLSFILAVFGLGMFCNAQEIVLSEDFDNGIPASWTLIDGDTLNVHPSVQEFQNAWIGLDDPFVPGEKIAGSTSYFDPEGKAFRFLVTPQIQLGSYGNILSWESMSHDPSFPDWIMVLISTTGNDLEDFNDTLFRLNNEFPYWTARTINLSDSGYVDTEVYLAFVNHTNQGFKLYLDNIQLEINNPVSIQTDGIQRIVLYPNPSNSSNLNISSEYPIESLIIIDQFGRTLQSHDSPPSSVDVSKLNSGIYFVRIKTQRGEEILRYQKL